MPAEKQPLTPEQEDLVRVLGTLFEGSRTVFGLKDLQHRYLYVNDEVERVLGHPVKEIIGSPPDRFLVDTSARAMRQCQKNVMDTSCAARFVEQVGIGSRVLTYSSVYFPLKNRLGMMTGIGFIGVHVEDHAWLNTNMQHMLEEALKTILDLQKQVEDMRLLATTDPLTGVWNRVQAEVIGRQEMTRQERYNTDVSVMFLDLDHFKNINDTWGHTIGDAVLIEFCQVVKGCLRAADVLARWGGEEFVIILPDTPLENALAVAERIRTEIQAHRFQHISSLTASFGIAAYMPQETWHHWIERADAALYRAKDKGRNCIELDRMTLSDDVFAEAVHSSGFLRLTWRKHYESGHPVVDSQHRQLFVLSNNLLSALLAGKSKESINILIAELIAAVKEHFRDEEAIIREAGFPDSDGHEKIHERIIKKALQLSKRYHDEKLELGELFSFLAYDVVAMHMLVDDREFFNYLNNVPQAVAVSPSPEKTVKPPAKTPKARARKSAVSLAKTRASKPEKSRKTPAKEEKKPRRQAKKAPSP